MNARSLHKLLFCLLLLPVLGFGCGDNTPRWEEPVVVVSVGPQAWFVKRLAGDLVRTEVMIPTGANPHGYETTIEQMRSISSAAVYFKVGHPHLPFEQVWLDRLTAESPDLKVVNTSAGIEVLEDDPHVWLSTSAARAMAQNFAAGLIELLPEERERIESNLGALLEEINELDLKIRATLEPFKGRKFFVFHPAWGYFADDYGLEQVAIEHEGKEPNPEHLTHLIDEVKASGAQMIFIQPQFPKGSAVALARETGTAVVPLDPLSAEWAANLERTAIVMKEAFERE